MRLIKLRLYLVLGTGLSASVGKTTEPSAVPPVPEPVQFTVNKTYLSKASKDLSILETAYATPYFKENEIQGFKLQSIDPKSPFLTYGFRPGDVILKVDKQPITNLGVAQKYLQTVASKKKTTITVLRNGKEIDLNYTIKP